MSLLPLDSGETVLFLMATDAEYGAELQKLYTPVIIGVGPVEAAVNTVSCLASMPIKPNYVVSVGSSGSARLVQGKAYQATSVSYRDMDASPLGFERGETPFAGIPTSLNLGPFIAGIEARSLSTGGDIVLSSAFADIEEDMVDMESFAIKRACMKFGIPLIALRGISDGNEELRKYSDWADVLEALDAELATAVEKTLLALAKLGQSNRRRAALGQS